LNEKNSLKAVGGDTGEDGRQLATSGMKGVGNRDNHKCVNGAVFEVAQHFYEIDYILSCNL
jgi:hypothetical protein